MSGRSTSSRGSSGATAIPVIAANIQHILLTRFNVRTYHGGPAPSLEWLLHRMDLFETLCFPSVASQTNQQFSWVVWLDVETPSSIVCRLERLQRQRAFDLSFVSHFDESVAAEQIQQYLIGAPYLLTTRLDNDDALATDYCQTLKRYVQPCTRSWINFDHGLQAGPMGIYRMYRSSNSFISFVERNCVPSTVMCIKHSKASLIAPIIHLDGDAWWLQVVHGHNLMNYISRPSKLLAWNKAEILMRKFCKEVITYVRDSYLRKSRCAGASVRVRK